MSAPSAVELRPLSIGEIFDRAVTLYVRNFALFSALLLPYLISYGVAEYMTRGSDTAEIARWQQSVDYFQQIGRKVPVRVPVSLVLAGVLRTVGAIYYFDVRVRQEGFDLEADIARLNVSIGVAIA